MYPLVTFPGGWELVLIVAVIVLLFGAKKLPEFARSVGSSLKIFKDETKGLVDGEDGKPQHDADRDRGSHPDADRSPREIPAADGQTPVRAEQTERREGPTA